ncbi:bile acid:sodium symporter family protein [Calidifontibacillus oryziterrae]|uniref:bile acid:sodium symporter family protein n=1 Tax=Calidifontibacillus oryziterrae TaxID=1191699 RepID=UPI000317A4DE|nr:bile acid:sodium symporter family protein [Calidifontibacillus oryziterrae]
MLQSFNLLLQRIMPIITPIGVLTGIFLSQSLESYVFLVPWIFAFMTFSGSLSSKLSDFTNLRPYLLPLTVCLFLLHVFMPLVAFSVGKLVFSEDPFTITGLVLSFIVPTGVSSLIWVTIFKGNVVLTLLIILIDTMLAPFLVPTLLHMFVGASIEINGVEIMRGLIWMIVIPSITAMLLNQLTKGRVNESVSPILAPFSKLSLGAIVALNSSAIASYFKNINGKLLFLIIVVFAIALIGYISGFIFSRLLKMDRETVIALTYNGGMRNIGAGAAIAITYFPAPVAVPVVVGMLFQQIIASLTGSLLSRFYRRGSRNVNIVEM